jgi:hypothetical protein
MCSGQCVEEEESCSWEFGARCYEAVLSLLLIREALGIGGGSYLVRNAIEEGNTV